MCLTHKRTLLAVCVVGMLSVVGCRTRVNSSTRAELNTPPLIVDEAMQKRDFDRMVVQYQNGDTMAGPDLVVIENTAPDPYSRVTDPVVSIVNDSIVPVTTVLSPPWKDVIYKGVEVPPTYTAQPAPRVIK